MPETIGFDTFIAVVITEFCLMALLLIVIIERSIRRAFRHLEETTVLKEEMSSLQEFVRDCRDNWDCDQDAHEHGTPCRSCRAHALLVNNILKFDCKTERRKK